MPVLTMITKAFKGIAPSKKYYIIKVTCCGEEESWLLETRLPHLEVARILLSYMKDSYKLHTQELSKWPAGYFESHDLDSSISIISRLRFIEYKTIEVPKTVMVSKTISTEL